MKGAVYKAIVSLVISIHNIYEYIYVTIEKLFVRVSTNKIEIGEYIST